MSAPELSLPTDQPAPPVPPTLEGAPGEISVRDAARLVRYMATTGHGTDACLEAGALPLPVHFYSPVPDLKDLEQRKVWQRRSPLTGIDFREEAQLAFLGELGQAYAHECTWPLEPTGNPHQFHQNNGAFSFGCAAILHAAIRRYRPRKIIEVGSGNSSRVISEALQRNAIEGHRAEYAIIDPEPGPDVAGLPLLSKLVPARVELLPPSLFDLLEEGDLLFIDSSHMVKIGGDVNYLYLDVLPRLKPGVIVHIHDIGLPYEYPKVYFTNPAFRVFWTESYLLQAFLAFNDRFEVLLGMSWVMNDHYDAFRKAFPTWDPDRSPNSSGSFWMRSKPAPAAPATSGAPR